MFTAKCSISPHLLMDAWTFAKAVRRIHDNTN